MAVTVLEAPVCGVKARFSLLGGGSSSFFFGGSPKKGLPYAESQHSLGEDPGLGPENTDSAGFGGPAASCHTASGLVRLKKGDPKWSQIRLWVKKGTQNGTLVNGTHY